MCIYCGTNKYRKIYKNHHGPIPIDETGRSHEIHHIDGNHANNDPNNLKCVSIKEHYDIHASQGDWAACLRMSSRLNISPEDLSQLASLSQKKRVDNGTHHLLGGEIQRKMVREGTHHLLSGKIQSEANAKRIITKTHNFMGPDMNKRRVEDGSHHFLGGALNQKRLDSGSHNFIQNWKCQYCDKEGKNLASYHRWHGINCKLFR